MNRRSLPLYATTAVALLALSACGSNSTGTGTPSSSAAGSSAAGSSSASSSAAATSEGGASSAAADVKLVADGKLTGCTHLSYKPFEFKDSSGKIVGMDIDLLDMAAKKLGVTSEIVDIEFAQITSGAVFAAGKCDIGFGATTITDKRKEAVLFSKPYFSATQALMAKTDAGVTDLTSLKGKKIGVQTDTTGQDYANKNNADGGYEVVVFDSLDTQLAGLQAGNVDAIVNDNGPLLDFAKENTAYGVTKEFDTGEQYGFMAMKDDPNGTAIMNAFDSALAESLKDGSYVASYKKWFGAEPQVLPTAG